MAILALTGAQILLRPLALGDVGRRADKLAIARCILYCASYRVDVLDLPVRQQQTIGMLEICRSRKGAINDFSKVGAVFGMDALHQ